MPSREPDARSLLEKLVGFDTVSSKPNLELIGFIAEHLAGYGVSSTLINDETGHKADLIATIGPQVAGGVLLAG